MDFFRSTITYKAVADCLIRADVYRPGGDELRPAILWLHGGALILGDRSLLPPEQLQSYLQAGHTVVAADYRLAPETKLDGIVEDVQEVYQWMRATGPDRFAIDPDRIAVVGHSAGGYLALLAGICLAPRPKALVSFYGYGDILGDWYNRPDPFYCQQPAVTQAQAFQVVGNTPISGSPISDRARFYLYCRQQGRWVREVVGRDPAQEFSAVAAYCPARNVPSSFPPTLLLHGQADRDVPYRQSVQMAHALAQRGVAHELIGLPDRGHSFDSDGMGLRDPVVAAAFDRVLAFLRKWLRLPFQAR